MTVAIGDVTTLNVIAEEIKTHLDACVPLSNKIVQLTEDFDLDVIQKLADELDACWISRFLDSLIRINLFADQTLYSYFFSQLFSELFTLNHKPKKWGQDKNNQIIIKIKNE